MSKVPLGVGVERWPCNPRYSASIPGDGNLKKLLIWMKIHGLTQKLIKFRWPSGYSRPQ